MGFVDLKIALYVGGWGHTRVDRGDRDNAFGGRGLFRGERERESLSPTN